jgi:hypothetical protein
VRGQLRPAVARYFPLLGLHLLAVVLELLLPRHGPRIRGQLGHVDRCWPSSGRWKGSGFIGASWTWRVLKIARPLVELFNLSHVVI